MLEIIRIPAFTDNYIWLLVNTITNQGVVIDPGDAKPVISVLKSHQIQLTGILITHHHADHCGGVSELLVLGDIPVYGPKKESIPHCSHPVQEGDRVFLNELDLQFRVLNIPGHTLGHVAYQNDQLLFCGDTLFTGGCGRLFEGTAEQMLDSLNKLKRLSPETQIYCGHEYTVANLQFALTIEPNNEILIKRFHEAKIQRTRQMATVPSTLNVELQTNPFLRTDVSTVINAANRYSQQNLSKESDIFLAIRQQKDKFSR